VEAACWDFRAAGTFRLIFSSASHLSAWKSGCRKVQLYSMMSTSRYGAKGKTYMLPKVIVIGISDLVEIVLVQLSDETGKVGMLEHAR
jgi:hypothetical protein